MKKDMKKTLRQSSQDFFAEQQLDEAQLVNLQQLQQQFATSENNKTSKKPALLRYRLSMVASVFFIAALLTFVLTQLQPAIKSQENLITAIANEVAKNHIKMKPLDVKSHHFNDMQKFFTQLEFIPTPSTYFQSQQGVSSYTLIGGRYCSIQSITAAQLRYGDAQDPHTTLYQTEYLPDVFGELPVLEQGQVPLVTYAKGLRIEIWVEKQLLMVSSTMASSETDR
ncbi:hypothetical protein R50073_10950 [Maricurvus nonylphenolicus]|uniref:hypothetical protein n=1 Tax=Maricurvus nonylphenolicus TaxID=1008307 RepID=UPI0036F19D6D